MGCDLSQSLAVLPWLPIHCCRTTSFPLSAPGGSCFISLSPYRLEASSHLRNLATPGQQPCYSHGLSPPSTFGGQLSAPPRPELGIRGPMSCTCSVQVKASRNHGGFERAESRGIGGHQEVHTEEVVGGQYRAMEVVGRSVQRKGSRRKISTTHWKSWEISTVQQKSREINTAQWKSREDQYRALEVVGG